MSHVALQNLWTAGGGPTCLLQRPPDHAVRKPVVVIAHYSDAAGLLAARSAYCRHR